MKITSWDLKKVNTVRAKGTDTLPRKTSLPGKIGDNSQMQSLAQAISLGNTAARCMHSSLSDIILLFKGTLGNECTCWQRSCFCSHCQ